MEIYPYFEIRYASHHVAISPGISIKKTCSLLIVDKIIFKVAVIIII